MKLNSSLLAKAAGLECLDPEIVGRLESYADLLIEANQKINLISRSVDPQNEIGNQIVLSLMPARLIAATVRRWIDIGSGGGFPVVPLAIIRPDTEFTAVEQIAKKAYFIERSAQALQLRNLTVLASPIEGSTSIPTGSSWDVVSIKAVVDLRQSLAWARKLLRAGGLFITYKPSNPEVGDESVLRKYEFKHKALLDVKELIDTIDVRVILYEKS